MCFGHVITKNAFELASFFWFWWQFGYDSCFLKHHLMVYMRLILGFAGQFLFSYSTLPLYALVTQMGTNYKAALIPQRIRDTIHGWGKETRRRRRRRKLGIYGDDSTVQTDTSTVISVEEFDHEDLGVPRAGTMPDEPLEVELQPHKITKTSHPPLVAKENSCWVGAPLLQPSASSALPSFLPETVTRSHSLPARKAETNDGKEIKVT
ncbi:hypothetical protein L6452_28620 [Arctium lappa]|uniref:Uncharacterized protein n=1 Tax=Arctium lappa TaxID=4217 RepID=A0ACB8ZZ73_ARCLA|nr:hypothetical protein L6452_28620 [Arctium lappa]